MLAGWAKMAAGGAAAALPEALPPGAPGAQEVPEVPEGAEAPGVEVVVVVEVVVEVVEVVVVQRGVVLRHTGGAQRPPLRQGASLSAPSLRLPGHCWR